MIWTRLPTTEYFSFAPLSWTKCTCTMDSHKWRQDRLQTQRVSRDQRRLTSGFLRPTLLWSSYYRTVCKIACQSDSPSDETIKVCRWLCVPKHISCHYHRRQGPHEGKGWPHMMSKLPVRALPLPPDLSRNISNTVHIGYNAIGYSAKSDIVPTAGWSRFPYSKKYRI